jgi:hypothetical protein
MLFRRNIRKMTQPELVLYLSRKLGSRHASPCRAD